jgi:hypothetical protein
MRTDAALLFMLALAGAGCARSEDDVPDGGPAAPDGGADASASEADADGGVPGLGAACRTHADCPPELACEYWEEGCEQLGECRVPIGVRGPDGGFVGFAGDAALARFGICSCDGRWLGNVYTDFPFQRRDFNGEAPCTAVGADAATAGCVPAFEPNCDNAGCATVGCDAGPLRDIGELSACPAPDPDAGLSAAVVITQRIDTTDHSAEAALPWRTPWYPPPSGCAASCTFTEVPVDPDGGLPDARGRPRSMGEIQISGLRAPDLTLMYPTYRASGTAGPAWLGGEALRFSATGTTSVDGLGAFEATVPGPTRIEWGGFTSPMYRRAGMLLQWATPLGWGTSGTVHLVVEGLGTNPRAWPRKRVECEYPVAAGMGELPAAVLVQFEPGILDVQLQTRDSTVAVQGGQRVHVEAQTQWVRGTIEVR